MKFSPLLAFLTGILICINYSTAFAQENNFNEDFSAAMPEIRAWNKNLGHLPQGTVLTKAGLDKARKGMNAFANQKTILKPTIKNIPSGKTEIAIRIFKPDTIRAVVLDIHGGGWSVGSAALDDGFNDEMARKCNVAVVSVEYRLAPESPFPISVEDSKATAKWLVNHAQAEFGTSKIFITGASAGAHLSALTTIYIRDSLHAIDKVVGVNLIYGLYDLGKTPSLRHATDSSFLSKHDLSEVFLLVFKNWNINKLEQPECSPLFADLKGLPPALFSVGTADPLVDDTYFMESRWRLAGNKTFLASYPECPHGFDIFPTKVAKLAKQRMLDWINNILK
ncbi:MAG: alpha/beta hydrolase [Chitinophagales bacterium]